MSVTTTLSVPSSPVQVQQRKMILLIYNNSINKVIIIIVLHLVYLEEIKVRLFDAVNLISAQMDVEMIY